jgi:hypothetical protein
LEVVVSDKLDRGVSRSFPSDPWLLELLPGTSNV